MMTAYPLFVVEEAPEMFSVGQMGLSPEGLLSLNETLNSTESNKWFVWVTVWSVLSPAGRFFACPPGWVRYKQTCYLFVSSARSWTSAVVIKTLYWKIHLMSEGFHAVVNYWRLCVTLQANCASLGASLASVHDIFDYSFLQALTRRSGGSTSWIGGFYFQVLWQSHTFNMKIKTSSNQSLRHDSPSWLSEM